MRTTQNSNRKVWNKTAVRQNLSRMARLFFVLVFLLATLGAPPVRVQAAGIVELDGDVHSATAAANESNINISHTTGTGSDRLMLVGVTWNSGSTARTISSVTFSYGSGPTVLNFTEKIAQKHSVATNYRYSAIWYLVAPPSGETGTVTVTFSDTVSNGIVAGVANFKGVDQTTPLGTALGASSPSNNTTPTVTLTGLNGDELVFDNVFLGGNPPASLTVGADQTQLTGWNSTISNTRGAASTEQATGSSVTMSWTAASNSMWVIAAVPINPGVTGPTQELTMAVNPGGGGTTDPAAGAHTYPQNEVVDITATPSVGYIFSSWSGDVADPNSASTTVTMDTDQSVTANFIAQNYDLTMAVDPSAGGTTTPAAGGPYSYGARSVVDITATPGCGYLFDHWSGTGIADVNAASTTVSMDAARTITAHFVEGPPIYLDGDVSSSTADGVSSIDVAHTSGTCDNRLMLVGISANSYNAAQTITSVTFTPSGETALTLDMVGSIENEAGRLAAIYSLLPSPSGVSGTVTVTFSGNVNNGFTVGVTNLAGVDQADPLDDFVSAVGTESSAISVDVTADTNDLVFDTVFIGAATIPTLSAGPNQDQLWSTNADRAGGAASTELAASTVTMSWSPTGGATAYYWAIGAVPINPAIIGPTQELTMAVNPGGGGTTDPAAGVYTYPQNEVVDITATPSVGYIFSSWSGDVADPNSASTTVTMDTDQSVTANFVAQNYDLTMAVDPSEGGTTTPAAGGPYSYGAGSVVDITATPGCGYLFDHWSGSGIADVNAASTTVSMDAARTITAHFVEGPNIFLDGEVSSNKLATGSSIEVAHTTGACANRLMLVGVSWNSGSNARTISSIIFTPESGQPVGLTEVVGHVYSANPRNAAIWALLDPPAGQDGTITVNFSDSVSNGIVVGVANFSGVDPSTPFGPTNVANASSNAPSVVLSGLDGDELVFDTVFYGGTDPVPALTADPSQTELWTDNTSNTRGTASIEQAAGNSVTMSWSTGTSSVWVIVAVAINPVSTDPTISVSGTPLIAFSSQPGVPSASQSYTVAGSNLTEGITITPPGDFEISLNDSDWTAFPSSLTLPETDGSVAETTIYVRFNRATGGTTTDDITHTSSGAAQVDVAVSGTATPIYTITVVAGANGSIEPTGPVHVTAGDNQAFTITADPCYRIADVLVDTVSQGAVSSYQFLDVQDDHTIEAVFEAVPVGTACYRVNAGGPTLDMVPDPDFLALQFADLSSIPGLTVSNVIGERSTENTISLVNVDPGLPMELFQTVLYNDAGTTMTFNFQVPDGNYNVLLHNAEHNFSSAGERIFDIFVEGAEELPDYDPYAEAGGQNIAVTESIPTSVSDGILTVEFVTQTSVPIIRGIEIVPAATIVYHTLTVSKGGNGSGLVTSDPGGIDCGSDCTEDYEHGTAVSLTAAADTGSTFDGWSGDLDCADGDLIMDDDRNCTATFTLEEYPVNINVNGHGTVSKTPNQDTYHYGDSVELEAFADPGWTFNSWSGDLEGNQNPKSLTVEGEMNVTASFDPPIERFHAQLTQNNVEGYDWTVDAEITLTIDDASNGPGVDFTDTQTVIEAEWDPTSTVVRFNDLGGIDLEAGDYITMTDGSIVKTHTVTELSLGSVDADTDTVYGTAAPGAQLTVQGLCEGNECSLRTVTAGGDGSWSADFTLPIEDQFDIKPGTTGEVIESDDDGDHTDIDWRVNDPTLVARPQQDQIEGLDWPLGELVTLFINDVEIDTQTVGGEPWYIGGSYVLFELDGIDLVPGDVVRLTHLSATKEHTVINLVQTDYDVEANTVTGTTNSDGDIDLWVHPGVEGSFITAAPAGGSWTAVFDPFDIVAGDGGAAMQYDEESDATYIDWQIPLPSFTTYPQSDQIEGHQWHLGDSVVLNINGDDLGTETVILNPWNPEETYVAFDLSGTHDLLPGDHVTLTSGSTVKDHIVTDLAVSDIDVGANTITGTTDPDSTLDVQLWVHPGVDGSFVFATPAGGSWTADFTPYDLEAGDEGPAVQTDADGDATWVEWRILLPNLIARPVDDQVEGNDWELGSEVTLTIDIDQYTDNATVGTAPWDPNMTYVLFDLSGIFDLQPGQVVTLSDGDTTKTHTITDLAVTVVDEALDTITGTATSPADVEVWAHEDYEASHAVDTPSGGTWSVNLAPFDLVPGHEGAAIQMDDDNDLTWVEWWVPYELTLNTSGDGSITPNPARTEFRPNSEVQLLAEAAPGWTFTSWSGDLDGSDNPATITMDSNKSITANFVQSITTHSIPLVEGWNLVSFNVHPADTAVAAVLATVDGNYDLVFAWDATGAHSSSGNWVKYDATAPSYQNTLSDLDETMGFWIQMTAADTLEVTGSALGTTTINLSTNAAGWNLVGYASSLNRDLPDALSDHGVGTDFSLVFAYHAGDAGDPWKLFDRGVDPYANDLTELAPGWGYWIKVSAGNDWSVDY